MSLYIALGIFVVLFGVAAWSYVKASKLEREIRAEEEEKKRNEKKERLETGNNRRDFDNSISILHDYSKD